MKKNAVALVGLLALFATMSAAAQTKMSGTLKCSKADPAYKLDAGDAAGHSYSLTRNSCTWTQAADIGGDKSKEGYSVSATDSTATHATVHGTHVTTMESGDKTFVAFHDAYPIKDGKPGDSTGQWSYTGGTGKLKGLKGNGTYKATPNDDGTVTVAVEGEYELPAPAAK
jgi:hypothetical protein